MALTHLLKSSIPCPMVKAQAEATGWDSQYTADSIVRFYEGKTRDDYINDTGDTDTLIIESGIGTLTLGSPNVLDAKKTVRVSPLAASDEQRAVRMAICNVCAEYSDKCRLASCCGHEAKPQLLTSKCPKGSW